MIRGRLSDAARSAAKAYAHDNVEVRHVVYAVAKEFGDDPGMEGRLEMARAALQPRGNSYETPSLTSDAKDLLDQITSQEDAVRLALEALESGEMGGGEPNVPKGSQAQAHKASENAVAAESAPVEETPAETVEDVLADLDALIGLGEVKDRVRSIIAVVQANTEREKAGLPTVNPSLHLVFTGPPGTGKTTVARLVARLYAATGAITGSKFTETTRADLIAGYVGQTAIKTTEVINKSRPGVLFIDEAYSLTPSGDNDFGAEAIATLVKGMEDHRDELAIIVAGYEDEMTDFITSNPGLRSRFKTYVEFGDYAPEELVEVFRSFVAEAGLKLADGVEERVADAVKKATGLPGFGNGRFARSLFEQAYVRMAERAAEDGLVEVEELDTLIAEDIELDTKALHRETRTIGFDAS